MKRRAHLFCRGRGLERILAALSLVACIGVGAGLAHGQLSDEAKKKRDAFLKSREEMRTVATPTPAKKKAGKPKAAPKKTRSKKKSPTPSTSPKAPGKRPQMPVEELPERATRAEEEPRAGTPAPSIPPPTLPRKPLPPADITIQKSGVEAEQVYEPPPPPPPRQSFWQRLFGGGRRPTSYRYLSRNVIEAIRRAPVRRSRWKFIIIHNSGTRQGNARAFDYYHRRVRRMQNGMAYHFVVGNGTSSGNGEIEVGERWRRQINGGHVHSDYLNNIAIGICLVGDFNRDQPTRVQLEATQELISYLRDRCGKADGRAIMVRPHREMNPPRYATDCPGDDFPYGWFRRF